MQIAIPLYDRFTALDAVGPYQVLSLMPGAEVVFVAERSGPVRNEVGSLGLVADATLAEVPEPDMVLVPGTPSQFLPLEDGPLREWLRAADATSTWTTSVCTGALILGAAGLLTGRAATTHWSAMAELAAFGALPRTERVVFDGKYVTSAGVSAGIDMGLTLVGKLAGDQVAQMIQLAIEYDPQPPYRSGSPETAPAEVVEEVRRLSAALK